MVCNDTTINGQVVSINRALREIHVSLINTVASLKMEEFGYVNAQMYSYISSRLIIADRSIAIKIDSFIGHGL